jgi:hypothetical protein
LPSLNIDRRVRYAFSTYFDQDNLNQVVDTDSHGSELFWEDGSRIQTGIIVKICIRIRTEVKIQRLQRLKMELWTLTIEAWRIKMEPWGACGPMVDDLHHFDEEQEPDLVRIRITEKFGPGSRTKVKS